MAESIASPDVKSIFAGVVNGDMPETAYRQAIDRDRPLLREAYSDYFAKHRVEAIVFPTTPLTARPVREAGETVELNGEQVPTFPIYIRNTDPGSNAGIPGLSIPLAVAPGEMPVGVEIDGPERQRPAAARHRNGNRNADQGGRPRRRGRRADAR